MKSYFIKVIALLLIYSMSSCHVTKRRYLKGFHVQRHKIFRPMQEQPLNVVDSLTDILPPKPACVKYKDSTGLEPVGQLAVQTEINEPYKNAKYSHSEKKVYEPIVTGRIGINKPQHNVHVALTLKDEKDPAWKGLVGLLVVFVVIAGLYFLFAFFSISVFTILLAWALIVLPLALFIAWIFRDWGNDSLIIGILRLLFLFCSPVFAVALIYCFLFTFPVTIVSTAVFYLSLLLLVAAVAAMYNGEKALKIVKWGLLAGLLITLLILAVLGFSWLLAAFGWVKTLLLVSCGLACLAVVAAIVLFIAFLHAYSTHAHKTIKSWMHEKLKSDWVNKSMLLPALYFVKRLRIFKSKGKAIKSRRKAGADFEVVLVIGLVLLVLFLLLGGAVAGIVWLFLHAWIPAMLVGSVTSGIIIGILISNLLNPHIPPINLYRSHC